jgi:alpha-beta hydrolase superfamily lysophospholipase/SAM-dependent methyltransferase
MLATGHEITESSLMTSDGVILYCRTWRGGDPNGPGVLLLHRGHEHAARLDRLVESLNLPDWSFFSYDMRGHGQSQGERGYAENYDVWVRDLDEFARQVCRVEHRRIEDLAVLGNSVGAVTACAWVHDYGARPRALVLAAPAFEINLYVPLAMPGLRLLHQVKPHSFVTSYVRPGMLTHDPDEAQRYAADPLITRQIAVPVLLGLHDAGRRLVKNAHAIPVPVLLLSAGRDYVVKQGVQRRFFAGLPHPRKQWREYPALFHAILYEKDAAPVLAEVVRFLRQEMALPMAVANGLPTPGSQAEYERLRIPAGWLDKLFFGTQAGAMQSMGRLSTGIRLGWQHGFDSGISLGHVYANRATGWGPMGRLIDRIYLNVPGWSGVRERKAHLDALLLQAVKQAQTDFGSALVLDPAAGTGRYLLELAATAGGTLRIHAQDYRQENAEAVAEAAGPQGMASRVSTRVADAFNPDSYRQLPFRPNVVVVSGLFELFPDNAPLQIAIQALAEALVPGGFLVYTGQPWHPQQEMIARTLTNREGQPWVMRFRSQTELDGLFRAAGFDKLETRVTTQGIFTVTLARKPAGG